MTSSTDAFRAARDLLLTHRDDYEAAIETHFVRHLTPFQLTG